MSLLIQSALKVGTRLDAERRTFRVCGEFDVNHVPLVMGAPGDAADKIQQL